MAPRQWFPGHTGRSPSSAWRRGGYLWVRGEERVGHVPRGRGLQGPQRPGPSLCTRLPPPCPPALLLLGLGEQRVCAHRQGPQGPRQARAGDGTGHTGWAPLPGTWLFSVPNYGGSVGTERRTGWSACGCDWQLDRQTARLGGVQGGTGVWGLGDRLGFQPLPRLRFPDEVPSGCGLSQPQLSSIQAIKQRPGPRRGCRLLHPCKHGEPGHRQLSRGVRGRLAEHHRHTLGFPGDCGAGPGAEQLQPGPGGRGWGAGSCPSS